MHQFLRFLSRRQSTPWSRYGIPILIMVAITVFRLFVKLDAAPFLLYLPAVILVSVASGLRAGVFATVISAIAAASFFTGPAQGWRLSAPQIVAVAEYLIVAFVMTGICDALRNVMFDNEANVTRLSQSQVTLAAAKEEAETSRDAAEAANRSKSAFLANMSHELRTPLSAVIGYSEMMEEEVEDLGEKGLLKDLGKIKSNAKHLLSLINDVLDLSKIEANRMDTFAEDVDVRQLVDEVAATVGSLIQQKSNALALEVEGDVGTMRTDVVKLRQCLFNLLSNACEIHRRRDG